MKIIFSMPIRIYHDIIIIMGIMTFHAESWFPCGIMISVQMMHMICIQNHDSDSVCAPIYVVQSRCKTRGFIVTIARAKASGKSRVE